MDIYEARVIFEAGAHISSIILLSELPHRKYGEWVDRSSVMCTWVKPGRIAWLTYKTATDRDMAKAFLDGARTQSGRVIQTFAYADADERNLFHLKARNLDPDIEEEFFRKTLVEEGGLQIPHKVKLREPASTLSEEDATAEIRNLLLNVGPLKTFWLNEDPKSLKQRATATYRHQRDALTATERLTGTVVEVGKLEIQGITKIKFNVSKKIANNLRSDFLDYWLDKTVIRVYVSDEDINKQSTTIRIEALGRSGIAATSEIRAGFKHLLRGVVASGPDETPIWHPFFATPEALSHLANLSNIHGGYIHRDCQKGRLLLYGDINFTLDANMDLLKSQRELFKGTNVPTEPVAGDCVVCWTEATDPLLLSCTHIYCKACFLSQAESGSIPLKCCGNENVCTHTFTIEELRKNLSLESFDELFLKSFKEYISARPTEYRYCPTPDCKSIYRPTVDSSTNNAELLYFCNACLSDICTFCNTTSHPGMSCAEHKQVEDTKALEEYKAANGTKVCPSCKALFEKKDGCNHIKCISCQIHICWVCLETFPDSGACYAHLSEIHGGNGLEADAVDIIGDVDDIDVEIQRDLFREIQMRRHEALLDLRALELLLPERIAPLGPFEAAAEAAALPHDAPAEGERFQALHGLRGGPPVPDPRAWDHVEAAMEAVLGDDAPVEREGFPAGLFGGPRDGLPAPPELRRFGHVQAVAEAAALPHHAPVEHEGLFGPVFRGARDGLPDPEPRLFGNVHAVAEAVELPRDAPVERGGFPARAFGGPRGFRGRFPGGPRGGFRGLP
jgi:hypothetical protein